MLTFVPQPSHVTPAGELRVPSAPPIEHHPGLLQASWRSGNGSAALAIARRNLTQADNEYGPFDSRSICAEANLGRCLLEVGKIDEARGHLEAARTRMVRDEQAPAWAYPWVVGILADLEQRSGDFAKCLTLNAEVRACLASGLMDGHRLREIARRVEVTSALALQGLGRFPEAHETLRSVGITESPPIPALRLAR